MQGTLNPIMQTDAASRELVVQKKRLYEQCREFESVMVSFMMKTMRDTVMRAEKPDNAREMYEDMLSQQISKEVGNSERLGLADMLYSNLEPTLEKNKGARSEENGQAKSADASSSQSAEMSRKLSELATLSGTGENYSLKNLKPFAD